MVYHQGAHGVNCRCSRACIVYYISSTVSYLLTNWSTPSSKVLSIHHSGSRLRWRSRFQFRCRSVIVIGTDYPSSSSTKEWTKGMGVARSNECQYSSLLLYTWRVLTSHVPAPFPEPLPSLVNPSSPEKTPLSDRGIVCGGGGAFMFGV